MKRALFASLAALLLFTSCAQGQKQPAKDPARAQPGEYRDAEKVVDAYIAAMSRGDLMTCATLMHTKALKNLYDTLVPVMEPVEKAGKAEEFLKLFSGVNSTEQWRALSPEELFAAYVKGTLFSQPGIFDAMKSMDYTIIGAVRETDTLIHVLYRVKIQGEQSAVNELETISMERDRGNWRLRLSRDIRGSVDRIKRHFGVSDQQEIIKKDSTAGNGREETSPEPGKKAQE